jgi:hypothetical protein
VRPPILQSGARWALRLGLLGMCAFAALALSLRADPARAYHSYLTAYAFALSAAIGCLAFVMIAHAANTTWPVAVRRLAEALAATLPCLALLFIPVLLGVRWLYPWAHPADFAAPLQKILVHRQVAMNPGFFAVRAGSYLGLWSIVALGLRQQSFAMERGADVERCARRLRGFSYAGLPLVTLSSGFAAFDWFMSLDPEFSSTMFGALWIALCLFAGLFSVILLVAASRRAAHAPELKPSHYSALGRLLLAFLVFLAYCEFFQFMLCWIGDRPSEAQWYLRRGSGTFWYGALFLIFGQLTLPFLFLLSYRLKRRLAPLTLIAAWCALSHYVHLHWLIVPESAGPPLAWSDLFGLVAVLSITGAFGLWLQRGKSLAAVADPRYLASFDYQSR